MLLPMSAPPLESPAMGKTKEPEMRQESDDDEVTFFCVMRRGDRQRLKVACARMNRDMKVVGGELIAASLPALERKLDKR
jgi:hypothetical protein